MLYHATDLTISASRNLEKPVLRKWEQNWISWSKGYERGRSVMER